MQDVLSNWLGGKRIVRNLKPPQIKWYTLQRHQSAVRSHMKTHDRLLVIHGTGSGKTLTAAHVAKDYFNMNAASNIVIFVTPKAVQVQFKKSVMSVLSQRPGIYFTTYESLTLFLHTLYTSRHETFKQIVSHAMIVADEAHYITDKTEKSRVFYDIFRSADKVLLMTGTPIINGNPEDLLPYARILNPTMSISRVDILKKFANFFKCKISIYKVPTNSVNFPTMLPSERREIPLTNNQMEVISKGREARSARGGWSSNRMLTSWRAFGNANEPKFEEFMKIFRERPYKIIVFFKQYVSLDLFAKFLDAKKIFYRRITGQNKNKSEIISKDDPTKRVVYLLTSSAKEGLDFKGVRTVIFMDYPWVPSNYNQIVGRASRYLSHASLPVNQRNVKVYNLMYKHNTKATINSRSLNILRNKRARINLMMQELMSISIEQTQCPPDPVRPRVLKPVPNRIVYRANRIGSPNTNYATDPTTGIKYHAAALNIPYNQPIIKKVNRGEPSIFREPVVRKTTTKRKRNNNNNKALPAIKKLFQPRKKTESILVKKRTKLNINKLFQ